MTPPSYFDRLCYYIKVTNPFSLAYSDEEVLSARKLLQLRKEGLANNESDISMISSSIVSKPNVDLQNIVDAAIHPVTSEVIPRLFRMSAIAPVNIPIVFAMLTCPPTNVAGTLFLHVLNQSYNAACNYANRPGSKQSDQQLLTAYLLAVSSACTIAVGLGRMVTRGPAFMKKYSFIIPCVATSFANVSNICFMRQDEILSGTEVFDDKGNVCTAVISCFYHCCNSTDHIFYRAMGCPRLLVQLRWHKRP